MKHVLRCRCGTIRGEVDADGSAGRAICYCKDCQAYARHLGRPEVTLDAQGGTEIVACLPSNVRFSAGLERLACLSLSDKGLLRWYADCCRTPIGNTPRDPKVAYVGLVRDCLPGEDRVLDAAFFPCSIALNTGSAQGAVRSTPFSTALGVFKIMKNVLGARLSGGYKRNPFFDATSGRPIRAPHLPNAKPAG
ncbi:MAG: DUF6151 family protein [Solirubrobacteraceae bacterium]|nr:DUF6151 family protein [Solirubrobacteraceae bacterium]